MAEIEVSNSMALKSVFVKHYSAACFLVVKKSLLGLIFCQAGNTQPSQKKNDAPDAEQFRERAGKISNQMKRKKKKKNSIMRVFFLNVIFTM